MSDGGVPSDTHWATPIQAIESLRSIHKEAIQDFLDCAATGGVKAKGPWRGPDGSVLYVISSPIDEVDRINEAVQDCYETHARDLDIEYQLALESIDRPDEIPSTLVAEAVRDAPWDCLETDGKTFDNLWTIWQENQERYLSCMFDQD